MKSAASLTWTAASDPKTVVGYKIYQDGVLIGFVDGNTISYTVTGLVPSTTYSFQVQAGNTYDVWSADGPIVSATTGIPAPPDDSSGDYSGGSSNEASVITGSTETIRVAKNGSSALAQLTSEHGKLLTEGQSITVSVPGIDSVTNYSISLPASGL